MRHDASVRLALVRRDPHVGAPHVEVTSAVGLAGHEGAVDGGVGRAFPEREELGGRLLLAGRPHPKVAVAVRDRGRLGDDIVLDDEFRAGTIATGGERQSRGGDHGGRNELQHGQFLLFCRLTYHI